jgi:3-phenylpropionate/trans-cinnamate dioxygenase ferredoxin subunit
MRHVVGSAEEFPPGSRTVVQVGPRSVGIINTGEAVYAVVNVCPHERAPVCEGTVGGTMLPSAPGRLVYGLHNQVLRCPWHGWEFDLATGRALFGTDRGRVLTLPVSVEGGRVIVETKDRAPRRKEGEPDV